MTAEHAAEFARTVMAARDAMGFGMCAADAVVFAGKLHAGELSVASAAAAGVEGGLDPSAASELGLAVAGRDELAKLQAECETLRSRFERLELLLAGEVAQSGSVTDRMEGLADVLASLAGEQSVVAALSQQERARALIARLASLEDMPETATFDEQLQVAAKAVSDILQPH